MLLIRVMLIGYVMIESMECWTYLVIVLDEQKV